MSEKEVFKREATFAVPEDGDGRTLEVRIVPYNKRALVSDPPHFIPYEEEWVEGAFDKQLKAANRISVFVNVEHERGIGGIVGHGTHLREVPGDGLHGTFRMLDHPDADKALALVKSGDLTGVSLEFKGDKSERVGNVVRRIKARLVNIALVRPSGTDTGIQAYEDAQVLAVRETPEDEPEPHEESVTVTPEGLTLRVEKTDVDELLERVGYEPLITRVVTKKPWDGSPARFEDDEYQRSCLIDRGGDAPVKERCSLPVLEPNGDINANALGAAAGRLNQTKASGDLKAKAARKLIRYYRQADMEPPPALRSLAAR